ncbi:phage tail domain-containing protein [Periweissella ghanensis]|uniref:Siphovirus-type tail component RIFT-related domain-containing protein n=1 Tax=Periweissella ghanensis TaxID=467997 RepID=A0ABM8ZC87_9LACO|nr:phage tail domain-containing protein [Periweissella ghanensis]MCM0600611.1 phage tail family protein [Periweissella ghanensis]CAH0418306.1 hypothetical protein WGH24286_00724 [Periweissella ghanensis]
MDLLITNNLESIKLSSRNIVTTNFDESSPSITANTLSFKGRNGKVNFGGDYGDKKLKFAGYLVANNQSDYETKRNWLYQILGGSEPYYITPMYSDNGQYSFERPGQTSGNIVGQTNEVASFKRFYVTIDDVIEPSFVGNINGRQIYKLEITFVTAELPFGESVPKTLTITNSIPYAGTAKASQLEVPFYLQITANQVASGFSLTIGSRTWTYSGTVATGDVFKLGGMYNTKNLISINDYTNAEYFVLEPSLNGQVTVKCSINATITINDYKELYL